MKVTGIASRTLQKAEEFAARHGIHRRFGFYEALLEAPNIEWARRALAADKHVLCEKRLAENAQ